MKTKNGAVQREGEMTIQESIATFDTILLHGCGIPYLLESRADTENDFDIKFKSDRHWHYFCWCLRNQWDVFSDDVFSNIRNAMRALCEQGSQLRLPRRWTGKETC